MYIDITFDPLNDAMNRIQHGFPLDLAREIEWEGIVSWVDDRHDYGEVREVGLAPINNRIFCVVFTRRKQALRIISLRRANNREEKRYDRSVQAIWKQHPGGGGGHSARDRDRPGYYRSV